MNRAPDAVAAISWRGVAVGTGVEGRVRGMLVGGSVTWTGAGLGLQNR
jgi:hypothetical protein